MADSCLHKPSPVGVLLLQAREDRLARIEILPAGIARPAVPVAAAPSSVLACAQRQLAEYFAGDRRHFDLPFDLSALPPFTRQVLDVLHKVPYGVTLTYAELARQAGSPRGARAVGQAMAANPLPIVIPCHRVVAAGGRIGGYSGGGGIGTKEWLLAFEQRKN